MHISCLTKNVIHSVFFALISLFSISIYAQSHSNTTGLTVEGKAIMKVKPDISIITFTLVQRDSLEKKAINKLNLQSNAVVKLINQIGILNENIRIGEYAITAERIYNPNLSAETTLVHVARNTIIIEIPTNLKMIDAFYKKMAESDFNEVSINIEHKVSKKLEDISRKKLTNLAIEDAKKQANDITSSLNSKLGPIMTIFKDNAYSEAERNYLKGSVANDVQFSGLEIAPSPFATLELNEIEIQEKITLVFQLI